MLPSTEEEAPPTSVDVVCGRDKESYNHTGNRRFRFVIAFNLHRYRGARSRKQKTVVVNALVKEIGVVGGRFLQRASDDSSWCLVDPKTARQKVAHALRDKFPLNCLVNAKAKLDRRIRDESAARFHDEYEEHMYYMAATKKLLRAELPDIDHSTDGEVEAILTKLLDDFANDPDLSGVSDHHLRKQQQQRLPSRSPSPVKKKKKIDELLRDLAPQRPSHTRVFETVSFDDLIPIRATQRNDLTPASMPDMVLSMLSNVEEVTSSPQQRQQSGLSAMDFERYQKQMLMQQHPEELQEDEMSNECGWQMEEDLPQNFSENDCENLISMLDFAAAI